MLFSILPLSAQYEMISYEKILYSINVCGTRLALSLFFRGG